MSLFEGSQFCAKKTTKSEGAINGIKIIDAAYKEEISKYNDNNDWKSLALHKDQSQIMYYTSSETGKAPIS